MLTEGPCHLTQTHVQQTFSPAPSKANWQKMRKSSQPAISDAKPSTAETVTRIKYRIAIVETDELIFELVTRWLVDAGHRTKAMSIPMLQRPNGFDLIIANVPNPRYSTSLIQALRRSHDSPILLLSARFRTGQAASETLTRELSVNAILAKPFTRKQLLDAVAQAMS
jgi:CheY-like chemotaxis protein